MSQTTQNQGYLEKLKLAGQYCLEKLKLAGQWCLQNRHFMVTASIMAVVWLGWAIIMAVMALPLPPST